MLKEGMNFTQSKVVKESETAAKVASGALEVFSTPMLIAFMESTAFTLAQKELGEGDTTVGISVNIKHLKANLIGDELTCTATLDKIEGRKLTFIVEAKDTHKVIGKGIHERFIINNEKFMNKLQKN